MRIAIIVRPDDASPKVLAISLQKLLAKCEVASDIFYEHGFLMRRVPLFGKFRQQGKLHFTIKRYLKHYWSDRKLMLTLKKYDAIVVSDCEPNGFWKHHFGIENLKRQFKKPIAFHEVYYLGNVPTHVKRLKLQGHPTMERYDWHLAVTDITEIKSSPRPPWSLVGLNLEGEGLEIGHKSDFFAIVDFERKGYEKYRDDQIKVLEKLRLPYVAFEERMSMSEIRDYYKKASLIFLSFPETFGVPIAECLACGTAIFTPSSSWPMSWRLDANPEPNSIGKLPNCFVEYKTPDGLQKLLKKFYEDWDMVKKPKEIQDTFFKTYPHFYSGNLEGVHEFVKVLNKINLDS